MTAKAARVAGLFLVIAAGCGSRDSVLLEDEPSAPAVDQPDLADRSVQARELASEADALWPGRAERAVVDEAIEVWEHAARLDPSSAEVQLRLTYAYYWLAHGHRRWGDDPEATKAAHDRGVTAGERAIKLLSPEFAARIKAGEEWESSVEVVSERGLPAIYWYAVNLGKWGLLDGITTIIEYKDRAKALIQHCLELDETFLHGAPHRYFGAYHLKVPFGKDYDASKRHFLRAVEIEPGYLEAKVLYAEYYAVYTDDEELFRRLLGEVLAAPDDVLPELVPENRNAKRYARKLLDEIEDFF